jgi:hypothetical protein
MASTASLSVEQLLQIISVDGFFSLRDASKGLEAKEFARKEFLITTSNGIEFCKAYTFGDPVSRLYPVPFYLRSHSK